MRKLLWAVTLAMQERPWTFVVCAVLRKSVSLMDTRRNDVMRYSVSSSKQNGEEIRRNNGDAIMASAES